jgi:hypothetical protein
MIGEVHTGFWCGDREREIGHLVDRSVDGKISNKMDIQEVGWRT